MEELLIGLGLWFLFRRKKQEEVIKSDEYTPSTGTRKPGTGDATDTKSYDFRTTIEETETDPWTWASRPAIFKEVPLSPGSRSRWLELGRLWVALKQNEVDLYGALRDAFQDDRERGGSTDTKAIIKTYRQKGYEIMAAIRRIVTIQRKDEGRYNKFLKETYGNATTSQFYEQRKQEILSGIWPRTETTVVPVNVVSPGDVTPGGGRITTGPGTGVVQMGTKYDREQMNKNPEFYKYPWYKSDSKRFAAPPGKRVSNTGNIYYDYRINRSDEPGKNI